MLLEICLAYIYCLNLIVNTLVICLTMYITECYLNTRKVAPLYTFTMQILKMRSYKFLVWKNKTNALNY